MPHASPGRPFGLTSPFSLGQHSSMVFQPSLHTCLPPETACDAYDEENFGMPVIKILIFFFSMRTNQTNETVHYPGNTPQCVCCELFILGVAGSTLVHALCPRGPGQALRSVVCHPSLKPGK